MSQRDEYAPGEFGWVDVGMPDVEAGARFYEELLGWEAQQSGPVEETGGYGFFLKDGKSVAGYGPLMGEGQPPAWSSYVYVADADQTAAKIGDAGGTAMVEPFDVLEAGRMGVFADPQGAVFCIWQPKQHRGAQLVNEPGSWTWNQLATRDLEGAKEFYGKVFGWTLEQAEDTPPDAPYYMWQVEGQRWDEGLAGAMEMTPDAFPAEVPPHWMVFLAVPDTDEAVSKTNAAGGQVMVPPTDIAVGRMAVLSDPQGAPFAVIQPDYPEAR